MRRIKLLKSVMVLALVSGFTFLMSCNDKDNGTMAEEPIASFQSAVDSEDYLTVTFTNLSQNAVAYAWDFGDGVGTSTEENPTYTYAAEGTYVVTLTATNEDESTDDFTLSVEIKDPAAAIRGLVGEGDAGKVWYLLADVSTDQFPYTVQPTDNSVFWWALGANEELCVRECIFDDTWTFKADGTYEYNNNGDFFGEWLGECFDTSVADNWIDGENDLSGWDSGTHSFEYDPTEGTLSVTGGFVGLPKATPEGEVSTPAASITYDVLKLVESDVDTLVVEVVFANGDSPTGLAYWRSTLVSYGLTTPVAVDVCEEEEIVAPTAAAPVPTENAASVISMFSDEYTDVTVDTWRTDWSSATLEDVTIDGSAMKQYSSLSFVGIETVSSQIDASSMTHLHFDLWTPNATEFKIKLVDFGPTGGYSGDGGDGQGDDTEFEVTVSPPTQGQWTSYDIPLTDFIGMNKANLAQYILSGAPSGSMTAFIDNVYFYTTP